MSMIELSVNQRPVRISTEQKRLSAEPKN